MKRSRPTKTTRVVKQKVNNTHSVLNITPEFLNECQEEFNRDPANIIARNAVVTVGCQFSTTNSNRLNEISHVFLNTVKKRNLKATNQGQSGRCWMFAALNTFRHILIKLLDLENFEFSETYLFFWDKFERCNSYMQWFIDHPEFESDSRETEYMLMYYMTDGGWWNTFANLINKYGLVPKGTMNETATSGDSEELNQVLKNLIDNCVNTLYKRNWTRERKITYKTQTLQQIYNTLVKFLGEPPKKFSWTFTSGEEPNIIMDLTPQKFSSMVMPNLDFNDDFIVLTNCPTKDMALNQAYTIKYTNNVYDGKPCTLFNTHIEELEKYAMSSIASGIAVWFVADVSQSFNWYHSALDDQLDDKERVFGSISKFSKGERITLRNVQGNHAMALTGFNLDERGRVVSWQVENSWGYWDNETPGLDGFLMMSSTWFRKYVIEIVVMKQFLTRAMTQTVNKHEPIEIEPWDSMAPATRVGVCNPPTNYLNIRSRR